MIFNRSYLAFAFLLCLGLGQMAADLLQLTGLKAVLSGISASPAPKVFSSAQGLETFSSRFRLNWRTETGAEQQVDITSHNYSRLRGPYNRRNVFGAALAYAPILSTNPATQPLFASVMTYAFCKNAPLLTELGVEDARNASSLKVTLIPKYPERLSPALPLTFEVTCP